MRTLTLIRKYVDGRWFKLHFSETDPLYFFIETGDEKGNPYTICDGFKCDSGTSFNYTGADYSLLDWVMEFYIDAHKLYVENKDSHCCEHFEQGPWLFRWSCT